MPQYNFGTASGVIQPAKPMTALYNSGALSAGVYYTVVNVSNGKGILSRVTAATGSQDSINLRITIDGVTQTYTGSASTRSIGVVETATNTVADWFFHTFFNSSLLVEVAFVSNTYGGAVCNYSLV